MINETLNRSVYYPFTTYIAQLLHLAYILYIHDALLVSLIYLLHLTHSHGITHFINLSRTSSINHFMLVSLNPSFFDPPTTIIARLPHLPPTHYISYSFKMHHFLYYA